MIAIKNMEMPATCNDCIFCSDFWWCQALDLDVNPVYGWNDWDSGRHPDCPLRTVTAKQNTIWKGDVRYEVND